jgi:hypothetical protein
MAHVNSLGNGGRWKIPSLADVLHEGAPGTACPHCEVVLQTLAAIREVYELHGMQSDTKSEESLAAQFVDLHFMHKADEKDYFAYMKYKCAAAFAEYIGTELPAAPTDALALMHSHANGVLVGGRFYAFYQSLKSRKEERSHRFFYSLLMLKKGLPRPSRAMLRKAELEAVAVMTTPDARSFSQMLTIQMVSDYARRIVRRLFASHSWSESMLEWPSEAAHVGAKRTDGGALEVVRDHLLNVRQFNRRLVLSDDGSARVRSLEPRFVRLCTFDSEFIEDETNAPVGLSVDTIDDLRHAQSELVSDALREESLAKPVCLAEPLKIRTVTCGPPLRYTALKPVQKVLWSQLSRDRRFAISRPLDGRQVVDLLGELRPGNKWLSGDYKAATDNLAIELSYHIAQDIATWTEMPDDYRQLMVDGLVGHHYLREGDEPSPQARGQLMGSPVSFPVLCIANAAIVWAAIAPDAKFEDVRMIINGDDCLFQTDDLGRHRWDSIARDCGMSPSVGKVYFHERFAVINSMLFDTEDSYVVHDFADEGRLREGCHREIPYLNLGLLLGLKRSGSAPSGACPSSREIERADFDGDSSVGARACAFLRGWTPIHTPQAIDRNPESSVKSTRCALLPDGRYGIGVRVLDQAFIKCNEARLKSPFCRARPWRVPVEFGGVGLPVLPGVGVPLEDMAVIVYADMFQYRAPACGLNPAPTLHRAVAETVLRERFGTVKDTASLSIGKAQFLAFTSYDRKHCCSADVMRAYTKVSPPNLCKLAEVSEDGQLDTFGILHKSLSGPPYCSGCFERRYGKLLEANRAFFGRLRDEIPPAMMMAGLDTEYWKIIARGPLVERPAVRFVSDCWMREKDEVWKVSDFPYPGSV